VGGRTAVDDEFGEFVAARCVALQRTAFLLTGDWASAEDLVQTALMKTYLAWRRIGGIEAVEPYTRKVMVNTATSWWRRRWRGERSTGELPERAYADGTEQWVEHDRVWQLIKALPTGQRAVLVLRFYEDLTEAETARLLGVSVGTVKRQAHRALESLRRRMSPGQIDEKVTAEGGKR
jgi:RNA polymerase sigma-70 factor, ECF subfamily